MQTPQQRKKYLRKHRKKILKYMRRYYQTHLKERKAYRNTEKCKVYQRRYMKKYIKTNAKKIALKKRAYRLLHRDEINASRRRWYAALISKKKILARNQTKKIPMKRCEKCGKKKLLERHHTDYDKPKIVMILCRKCHRNLHKKRLRK